MGDTKSRDEQGGTRHRDSGHSSKSSGRGPRSCERAHGLARFLLTAEKPTPSAPLCLPTGAAGTGCERRTSLRATRRTGAGVAAENGWAQRTRHAGVGTGRERQRGCSAGGRVAFAGALTFTVPTRLGAFRTTLSTFRLLSIFLGVLGGPLLLVFFLPDVFVVGPLLRPPLALVLVHLKGPLQRLGGFDEAPNAGLGLGKARDIGEPRGLAGRCRPAARELLPQEIQSRSKKSPPPTLSSRLLLMPSLLSNPKNSPGEPVTTHRAKSETLPALALCFSKVTRLSEKQT